MFSTGQCAAEWVAAVTGYGEKLCHNVLTFLSVCMNKNISTAGRPMLVSLIKGWRWKCRTQVSKAQKQGSESINDDHAKL